MNYKLNFLITDSNFLNNIIVYFNILKSSLIQSCSSDLFYSILERAVEQSWYFDDSSIPLLKHFLQERTTISWCANTSDKLSRKRKHAEPRHFTLLEISRIPFPFYWGTIALKFHLREWICWSYVSVWSIVLWK